MGKSDVQDFVAMRNAPDSTYALLGRGLDEVANREEAAEAGMDYADMMKVHEIATKHLDIFGHPEDESDSANAMRALFGLEEEETERSMLGCARSLPACRMPSTNCSTSTASPTSSAT